MYVNITGVKGNKDVYIYQSYRKENGKTSSCIYKKLGKYNDLLKQLIAFCSAQFRAIFASSIVKMIYTRPFLSIQLFLADRLMQSSKIPYSILASAEIFQNLSFVNNNSIECEQIGLLTVKIIKTHTASSPSFCGKLSVVSGMLRKVISVFS